MMFGTIDRYVLREVIVPFVLALFVLTFLLMLPPIMGVAEELIEKGVALATIAWMMVTLLPQGLGVTIPMALLLGILMGLGRLSSDRETVAMQACGVSIFKILRPLSVMAFSLAAITCYVNVVSVPDANQAFREMTFQVLASRAEGEVKPRIFYDTYPNINLYVREVSTETNGWRDVFLADTSNPKEPDIYVAQNGRVVIDQEKKKVDLILYNGTGHIFDQDSPNEYEVHTFEDLVIQVDAETMFPRNGPQRGLAELTITQLRAEAERLSQLGLSAHGPIMSIHRKFSIPIACLVFTLIALGLGVTSRKDGKLASFALGIGVIFTYYVIMYTAEAMAKGAMVSPQLAMWIPNLVLGAIGVFLVVWRSRSVERRTFFSSFRKWQRSPIIESSTDRPLVSVTAIGLSASGFRTFTLLDRYVLLEYLRWAGLAFVGLLVIFYISTFIDLSDKLFKGQTTGFVLLEYFWYATPQFIYYVLPISALVGTLITVGVLTKTSELTVMKACGISLYRIALPIVMASLVWSGVLFGLEETILAESNQKAELLRGQIRTGAISTGRDRIRNWVVGSDDAIYHFLDFEADRSELTGLTIFQFEGRPWRLYRRTFAATAKFNDQWQGRDVWVREFPQNVNNVSQPYTEARTLRLPFVEKPTIFREERVEAAFMSFQELQRYIEELRERGIDVTSLLVSLHRKLSFPFVTFILTLIAVPFAVTTGSRGALYGIGVGICLAFSYWIILSIFGALGSAGLIAPTLAAWAPNIFFGGSAAYLLLLART